MTGDVHDALPYWTELTHDGLYLPWCEPCDRYLPLGVGVCSRCGAVVSDWRRSAGTGEVWSYTVVRRPFVASAPWTPPYAVAMVELVEGPKVVGAVVGFDPDDVRVGLRVRLVPGTDASGSPVLAFEVST